MEKQYKIYFGCFLMNDGYGFSRFNYNRELIPDYWRSYKENTFVNIIEAYSFRNKTLFVIEHIGISEKCSRPTRLLSRNNVVCNSGQI